MNNKNEKDLFAPVQVNGANLANRIVMAPMTRSRAIGNMPNGTMATYYAQRASAGLIITEGIAPSPNALGYARIPGIFYAAQTEGWKQVTKAVHTAGGKIFAQLMHTGRIGHPANMPENARILAASAVSAESPMWTDTEGMQQTGVPEEMNEADLQQTIQEFVQASLNAIAAGFDGVELHGANGYLLEQFLNPSSNQRTDSYGGSIENRVRFVLETTRAVAAAIGKEKVGYRISPYSTFNTMPAYEETFDTYDYLSKELHAAGILYLHLVDYAARATDDGKELIKCIRGNFGGLLMLNGGYTKERAEEAMANEGADLISFGTPFIANPDLPYRLQNNIPLSQPDAATFYTLGEAGYTDYAYSNTEHEKTADPGAAAH